MLVPEIAQGASDELADLRSLCDAVVRRLVAAANDTVTVVASAPEPERWGTEAGGSLRGFGVDVRAGGPELVLTPELTMGAWLLDRAGWQGEREYRAVRADTRFEIDVPVLVMADGSAKRTDTAPGHIDERALAYDKVIAHALATGDAGAFARLDVRLGEHLWAAGAPAMCAVGANVIAARRSVRTASLHFDEAPYGVGYFVASWCFDGDGE